MEKHFARALYDNTAETVDELAFRKGDIIMVLEKNVAGSTGWWKCCLHDRQGLAPANRLALLSLVEAEKLCIELAAENDYMQNLKQQSIYQVPKVTKAPVNVIYEEMRTIYTVPLQTASPDKRTAPADREETRSPHDALSADPRTGTDIYDVPSLVRKNAFFTPSSAHPLETSLTSGTEFHNRYELLQNVKCATTLKKKVATVSPMPCQDPNYDIPVPSCITEDIQKPPCGYSTMPKPCKSEWIYDVPVFPQKQGCEPGHYDTMPPKTTDLNMPLYDTLPTQIWPKRKHSSPQPLYDIPKPSNTVAQSSPNTGNSSNSCIYDVPPCLKQAETTIVPPRQRSLPEMDSEKTQEPLEYGDKPGPLFEQQQVWSSRGRMMSRPVEGMKKEGNKDQRISTLSTSSTASSSSRSSCDSFMLSSPEPEPLREVTISQEEATNRLFELQEVVCQSVPKLMLFVSSQWRSKEHLSEHLQHIRVATEDVTDSVTCFLNFALYVKGNAQRLTDMNLQARLLKQFSILEDSGVILQQAAGALRDLGWLLDSLAQDASQSHTPDHLERFVMVARTIPEDVKRLVSIVNANSKLLFRVAAKEPEVVENAGSSEGRIRSQSEPLVDSGIDESDCVQLQQTKEFDQHPKPAKSSFKTRRNGDSMKKQTSRKPSISDHCRLYFGALQKAITEFISSLNDGQPPERFISHSKLVIMVGQRLINSLCNEAKQREGDQSVLSMSNQLCAHLKQLAMVTKKAALNFPDKPALQEAQDVAKELARMAQHFRMSLDI